MEHRVGDLGEGVTTTTTTATSTTTSTYLRPAGAGVTAPTDLERARSEHCLPVHPRLEPTARSVDVTARPVSQSRRTHSQGSKRKISRLEDNHATEPHGKISSSAGRHQHPPHHQHHPRDPKRSAQRTGWGVPGGARSTRTSGNAPNVTSCASQLSGVAGASPKRVDFSERLHLREVRWDGTYRDRVAHPAHHHHHNAVHSGSAASTITTTAANSSSATFASSAAGDGAGLSSAALLLSPSSFSSAVVEDGHSYHRSSLTDNSGGSGDVHSTLTDSRAIRETEIRFLNDHLTEVAQDRLDAARSPRDRLTHVHVEVPGGGGWRHATGGAAADRPRGHDEGGLAGTLGRECPGGREVAATVTSSGHGGGLPSSWDRQASMNSSREAGRGGDVGPGGGTRDGDDQRGAVGGRGVAEHASLASARLQKIKKTLKDLPNDEGVLAKLREKIRQQRLSASSSENSQSEAWSTSQPATDSSREPTPQHVLHEDHEAVPVRGGQQDGRATPDKVPRTRKVATGPPTPSYKGFSEVTFDPFVRQVRRQSGPRRKGTQKPTAANVQAMTQTHVRLAASSAFIVPSAAASSVPAPDRPRRGTRIVAAHGKRPSKPGAKAIITTSSWRVGQEVILRELGPVKARSQNPSKHTTDNAGKDGCAVDDHREGQIGQGDIRSSMRLMDTSPQHSSPVAAEGSNHTEQLARSRALSEEAKKMLVDLQLDNKERERRTISFRRPAVKRKAPKPEKESDEHTAHKHKHYNSESVRQYIARQKAQRQRQKDAQRQAEKEAAEKRQQLLLELIAKQKSAATSSKAKVKRSGENQPSVPSDQGLDSEQNVHLMGSSNSDKENANKDRKMEVGEDEESDADTLTGSSEDFSTPRATPVENRDQDRFSHGRASTDLYHNLFQRLQPLQQRQEHIARPQAAEILDPNHSPAFFPAGAGWLQAGALNLNVDAVLSRFAQVVDKRRALEGYRMGLPGSGTDARFRSMPSSGDSHSERLWEEKLHVLKANSKTLQSKLAHMDTAHMDTGVKPATFEDPGGLSLETEFVSRHERITGSRDKFSVFTSGLPGAQNVGSRPSDTETASEPRASQAARREAGSTLVLPRESTLTSLRKTTPPSVKAAEKVDEDSSVTDVSTFSEISATDESSNNITRPKILKGPGAGGAALLNVRYKAPSAYRWEEPKADPYSVFNVFSRQTHYGSRALRLREDSHSADSAPPTNTSHTSVRDPVFTSTQHIVSGHTAEGHHVVAKATYTRMEATLLDGNQKEVPRQTSQHSLSSKTRASRSEERVPLHSPARTLAPSLSVSDDSRSLESAEEELPKAGSHRQGTSRQLAGSFQRQTSDTGQETDVSQMSEDEPRTSLKTYEGMSRAPHVQEEPKWSPAALERQMATELARLESLGDSLHQLNSMERTQAVALAQQETVSLAQILKARQQEHNAELRSLQMQVQEERLASAKELQKQLHNVGLKQHTPEAATSVSGDASRFITTSKKQLLEQAENRRPETKISSVTISRPTSQGDSDYSETATSTPFAKSTPKFQSRYSHTSSSRTKSAVSENAKTADDTRDDSDSSIKTASDVDTHKTEAGIAEEVPGGDYSMSFEDSLTEDESFKQVLPSESHRKDAKRHKSGIFSPPSAKDEASSLALGDLSSLFVGEDSFSRFTADMVRQIMREEDLRAQHQAALLRLREKALKEKTRAELAWLKQQRQHLRDKGADDVYPQLERRKQNLLKQLQEQQAEIRHLQEANRLASKERQSLLKQHEEIARMRQETQAKLKSMQEHGAGRLGRPAEVHTEDEASLADEMSDASEDISGTKEAKSDSEMYGDLTSQRKHKGEKQNIRKQQKLRLDQKYLTAREQKLMERQKNASELLKWKHDLDTQEEKVLQMERSALHAWGTHAPSADKKKTKETAGESGKDLDKKVESLGNLRPETAIRSEKATPTRDGSQTGSISEAISMHTSVSKSDITNQRKMHMEMSTARSHGNTAHSPQASGSESSIPEDIPDGTPTDHAISSREKQRMLDSSDETVVNSSVNEEDEADNPVQGRGRKSSVGRLLPPGNSPLPVLWSRKTGSESESEESVSHTETLSDVSDYEARIRQLSDLLQRRRKEADMLKKERSRRKKDKLKAQEESLKKQLEAYENFITQLKTEQADLEHEAGRPTVRPQIKQPKSSPSKSTLASPSFSSPSPPGPSGQRDDGSNSSSPDEARDSTESNQTSPALSDGHDSKTSPVADKEKIKKKSATFMDRISEGSESRSEPSVENAGKSGRIPNGGLSISENPIVSEAIEEAVNDFQLSRGSQHSHSGAFSIKTGLPAMAAEDSRTHNSLADDVHSYSMDFTEAASQSLAQSHGRVPPSARSEVSHGSGRGVRSDAEISECIESRAASSAKSQDGSSSPPKLILNKSPSGSIGEPLAGSSHPATGIQESDSENESRINSHRSLSRPSSERSTGSTTFSDMHDFEEEEDIVSSESDRTPARVSTAHKEKLQAEKDVSISASLPSLSEKLPPGQPASVERRESLDAQLGDLLGFDEDEAASIDTPRAASPLLGQEENSSLMLTDPLADFLEGDRVLVGGVLLGRLRFKGPVAFAPGFWAGVELDRAEGDMNGECEGKRYFHCKPNYGVLVPGSEISLVEDLEEIRDGAQSRAGMLEEAVSPDNSVTDQDDVSSATEDAEPVKMTVSAVVRKVLEGDEEEERENVTLVEAAALSSRQNIDLLADNITTDMTQSLMNESIEKMATIASRQSAATKVPPPTLPKPTRPQQQLPQPATKAKWDTTIDTTTTTMVGGLLADALTKMIQIRQGQRESGLQEPYDGVQVNGLSDDSGVDASRDSSRDRALAPSPDLDLGHSGELKAFEETKRPLSAQSASSEPFLRPKSPIPGDGLSSEEREELDADISGVLGDDNEFFDDDDFGISKLPPPYPGAGDAAAGEQHRNSSKQGQQKEIFAVPHERAEVERIVAEALKVFWNLRRCGEPWESVPVPVSFLQEGEHEEGAEEVRTSIDIVTCSRRSYRHLLFDLTGEIVRAIYQHENEVEPPAWQKAVLKRQRHYKGAVPPTTMDVLLPVVQQAAVGILGLNGAASGARGKAANKWNVRKKKDHVDAVLARELQEEEPDWINYNHDETAVKLQLTDTIFESLLTDTVDTLNQVYARRQLHSQQH